MAGNMRDAHPATPLLTTSDQKMQSLTLKIDGMSCGHCVMSVQKALRALDGVQVDQVLVGSAQLQFDPARRQVDDILEAIRDEGFAPSAVATA